MVTENKKKRKKTTLKMPVKQNINFAHLGEKKIKWEIVVPTIIAIILLMVLLVKVAVVDRYYKLNEIKGRAEREVQLQNELYIQIKNYESISTEFAHYSYDGFTDEELSYVDRCKVFELIENTVMTKAEISDWSLSGNVLILNLFGINLQDIAGLSRDLKENPIVDYCQVSTAQTYENESENQDVNAVMTVYLLKAEKTTTVANISEGRQLIESDK